MPEQPMLVKIHVELPHHWGTDRETFWAEPVGEDLYQLRNVPFFAYGLNFLDVVRAAPGATDSELRIISLDRPSGHQTLRVIFTPETEAPLQEEVLSPLDGFGATAERYNASACSVDIPPTGDFNAVFELFEEQEGKGILSFEGNEQREEGSFDDPPPVAAP